MINTKKREKFQLGSLLSEEAKFQRLYIIKSSNFNEDEMSNVFKELYDRNKKLNTLEQNDILKRIFPNFAIHKIFTSDPGDIEIEAEMYYNQHLYAIMFYYTEESVNMEVTHMVVNGPDNEK